MTTKLFDVPNLDDVSVDPDELSLMADVLKLLHCYTATKCRAMTLRAHGNIVAAIKAESACERIYNELPEWARW